MKKILNKLFGRLVLTAIIILIQFGWIAFTLYEAGVVNPWFSISLRLISLVCALYVVYKDMRPHGKMSWIFLILLLPFIGCPCYFLFGRSEMTKKNRQQIAELQKLVEPMREPQEEVKLHLQAIDDIAYKQMSLPQNTGSYPVYMENDSKYYSVGDDMFVDMIEDIKNAKEFIFLEFFIMKQGVMFDTLVDALAERAKAGVHIRLIYDDMGCIDEFPRYFYKDLQAKGIHVACFNPFRPFLSIIMNKLDLDDLLIITSDHGKDPTFKDGNDHTRENLPVILYSRNFKKPKRLEQFDTLANIGAIIADNFDINAPEIGKSILEELE